MKKTLLSAALAVALFAGCNGGVDKNRLAQLTGDKSFDQVKEAYKSSIFYEKTEDVEIYKYYLIKNGGKVTGFDFDMYSKKVQSDHQELKTKLESTLGKCTKGLKNEPRRR